MPPPTTPTSTIRITTYEQLRHHITAFASGKYPFLMLIGAPGLGKSRAIKEAMRERSHLLLENHATAFALYEACYRHQDQPLILDDLDYLYRNDACVRLLKALCNTDPAKSLRWLSTHPMIGDEPGQIPGHFTTSSPVCLLTNEWTTSNDNVRAIEDRAIVLKFEPSGQEVHREVGQFKSQSLTVFQFMGEHLSLIPQPSIRHYVRGAQLQQANPDCWKDLLLESMGVDKRMRVIALLAADDAYPSEEARVQAYVDAGLGARATYFRVKAELMQSQGTTSVTAQSSDAENLGQGL